MCYFYSGQKKKILIKFCQESWVFHPNCYSVSIISVSKWKFKFDFSELHLNDHYLMFVFSMYCHPLIIKSLSNEALWSIGWLGGWVIGWLFYGILLQYSRLAWQCHNEVQHFLTSTPKSSLRSWKIMILILQVIILMCSTNSNCS